MEFVVTAQTSLLPSSSKFGFRSRRVAMKGLFCCFSWSQSVKFKVVDVRTGIHTVASVPDDFALTFFRETNHLHPNRVNGQV